MGSPPDEVRRGVLEAQRAVTIRGASYLARTPVTQAQFADVTGENPTAYPEAGEEAPADSVSWDRARDFCARLTERDREAGVLPADWEYRLPPEALWEYACRAGSTEARYGEASEIAWFGEPAARSPQPVAQKAPNAWGFHDTLGNLWEWCAEWFLPEYSPENAIWIPSEEPADHAKRSLRGGSWYNSEHGCRAAMREAFHPSFGARYVGFRLFAAPVSGLDIEVEVRERSPDDPKTTPLQDLYETARTGDIETARALLSADPSLADAHDEIPPVLHWAVIHNQPELLGILLDHGADPERLDQDEEATALSYAVIYSHPEIVELLVRRGANSDGMLDRAKRGADGEFDVYGMSPEQYVPIVALLERLGVD
ncbi:MAG: SUMF1/EgtB/PvdO family nonheme iron enzyme [Planctomycetota bacterium]